MPEDHILVKHRGSRRQASWKDPDGLEIRNRTREQAVEILTNLRSQIHGPEDFAEIAKRCSDCSSARSGGDLGEFQKGQMMRPFEEATLSLNVGEISGFVDTDSGTHIILRTG